MSDASKKWKKAPTYDEVINEAIEREDWFSGFSNAVTYFEHWGYWRLQWYCIKEKIDVTNKLKNLRVSPLALVLYILKLIDTDTFTKINEVLKERNRLIHPASAKFGISYRYRKEKDTAIRILENAKQCIKKVKEGIGKEQVIPSHDS